VRERQQRRSERVGAEQALRAPLGIECPMEDQVLEAVRLIAAAVEADPPAQRGGGVAREAVPSVWPARSHGGIPPASHGRLR
jgi:hypothetical protein